jgi:hypothetical protein
MEKVSTYFTVEPHQKSYSKITFEMHFQPKFWLAGLMVPFLKLKLRKTFADLLERLKEVAEHHEEKKIDEPKEIQPIHN